jgi:hypothetical protein
MRLILCVLLACAFCYATEGEDVAELNDAEQVAGAYVRICDIKATVKLAPEVVKLLKKKPLKFSVAVVVLRNDLCGWFVPKQDSGIRTIYIWNRSEESNLATLRHEWHHAWESSKGMSLWDASAEERAMKAETE